MSGSANSGVYVGVRDVVSVAGPEAVKYLQGQVSQDVASLAIGASAWSLILQPQGKVDAWFRVGRTGEDSFLLDVDAPYGEVLLARLNRFLLRTKVDLSLETWPHHAYADADAELPAAQIVSQSLVLAGHDVIGPDLASPGCEQLDDNDYLRARILAGVPAMGAELNENTIPAEAGIVDRSVSFTKGCYTGQELVARVDSRGNNTPRKLRIVTGAGVPEPGTPLTNGESEVGFVTSVAVDGDGFAALAYVKRNALDAATLELEGRTVLVTAIAESQ